MTRLEILRFLETDIVPLAVKTRNHPQTSQTSHKTTKLPTNEPNHTQTSHKPDKPNTPQPIHPQTNQISDKPPTKEPILSTKSILPKTLATMQKMC